ncbi:uncharacterized protein UBRO_06918 [Ustilago bromivora]|uniref:Uncharacterized protein n=1 Tax=Ustilago bromivora TaxID=307758 RepID=A0A1K0G915_9BASI|nr:uncharacterized protein UBRO_06918 [Ustilago bromivora]SYW85041.1 uncharacterized protein UBRO2_05680 [Ustilago bromivora]
MSSLRSKGTGRSTRSKATLPMQSDENLLETRRALGDIKNILVDRKAPPQTSDSPRMPFGDRNAPLATKSTSSSKRIEKQSRIQSSTASKRKEQRSRPEQAARQMASKPAGPSKAVHTSSRTTSRGKRYPTENFTYIEIPSPPSGIASSPADALSAQIEAAAQHAEKGVSSEDELTRLSPRLDSDDLEYFDVDTVPQTKSLVVAATTKKGRREQGPSSKDEDSDVAGTVLHGSSDKENVPPPAARRTAAVGNIQSTRTRTRVLRAVESEQPTHSTPISQKRKALRDRDDEDDVHAQSAGPNLDDLFAADSDRSSGIPSPGVGRRAAPLIASVQQLQDYQDRGVSKVVEWKAAGHHRGESRARKGDDSGKGDDSDDISNADSWPDEHKSAAFDAGAQQFERSADDDDELFGFLTAMPHARQRSTQLPFDEESQARSEQDDSDLDLELPTDPFSTNDDRRLAEKAFAHMSSPPPRQDRSSSTAPLDDAVPLGKHKLHAAPQEETETDTEGEAEVAGSLTPSEEQQKVDEADKLERRVIRSRTKLQRIAATTADTDDEYSPMSTAPPSTHMRSERAAKANKATSGIPLKRNEKEQDIFNKLAAQDSWSPAPSSAPTSPRTTRTSKNAAASPAAKKLRMDDILGLLPSRKRHAIESKSPASVNKRKGTHTSKSAKSLTKASASSKAKADSKGNGRKRKGSTPEDSVVIHDDSDEAPRSRTVKRNTKAKSTSKKRKKRAISDDEERWRKDIGSSPVHSDDSERTKRLKEYRAAEKYNMEVEVVL